MRHGLLAVLIGLLITRPAVAASVEEVIAQARNACESMEDGTFHADEAAVANIDLNRDGQTETLIRNFKRGDPGGVLSRRGGPARHVLRLGNNAVPKSEPAETPCCATTTKLVLDAPHGKPKTWNPLADSGY